MLTPPVRLKRAWKAKAGKRSDPFKKGISVKFPIKTHTSQEIDQFTPRSRSTSRPQPSDSPSHSRSNSGQIPSICFLVKIPVQKPIQSPKNRGNRPSPISVPFCSSLQLTFWPWRPCGNTQTCTHPLPWKPAHANTRLQGKLLHGVCLKASHKRSEAGNAKRLQLSNPG